MSSLLYLLFILAICFISGTTTQIIDNNTLIYNWDSIHNISFYCQFASSQDLGIKNSAPQSACFHRNIGMQHILANGEKTFPYISFGSSIGFLLKCGDIPQGKLLPECRRDVHSSCSFVCDNSEEVRTMKCYLMGPWTNVTARWADPNPCLDPAVVALQEGPITNVIVVAVSVPLALIILIGAFVGYRCRHKLCGRHSDLEPAVLPDTLSPDGQEVASLNEDKTPQIPSSPIENQDIQDKSPQEQSPFLGDEDSGLQDNDAIQTQDAPIENKTSETDKSSQEHSPLLGNEDQGQHDDNTAIQAQETESEKVLPETACLQPVELGISEIYLDSDYNRESGHKPKVFYDPKGLMSALNCSTMDLDSLKNFNIELISGMDDNVAAKAEKWVKGCPSDCSATVELLKQQKISYRKKLRPELEVIPGIISREQALIGYIEEHAEQLGYTENEIKMIEVSCESRVDDKASDIFLQKLAEHGIKLGSIVQYFYTHENYNAVEGILEVHKDCDFCQQFRH